METLEHWRESFPEIQSLNLEKLLPNLAEVCSEQQIRNPMSYFAGDYRVIFGEYPSETLPNSQENRGARLSAKHHEDYEHDEGWDKRAFQQSQW